jgi:hypothetical protein
MAETTLYFINPSESEDVLAPRGGLMRAIDSRLGVSCTARDHWLKISGESEASVARTEAFVQFLRHARSQGADLRGPTSFYMLERFLEGLEADLRAMVGQKIEVMPGKRPVFPKTLGQAHYLEQIRRHDVTLGLGPAGTDDRPHAAAAAHDSGRGDAHVEGRVGGDRGRLRRRRHQGVQVEGVGRRGLGLDFVTGVGVEVIHLEVVGPAHQLLLYQALNLRRDGIDNLVLRVLLRHLGQAAGLGDCLFIE